MHSGSQHKQKQYTLDVHINHGRYLDSLKVQFLETFNSIPVYKKSPDDFDKIKTIGKGGYGAVFLVRDKHTFIYHAMKAVDKEQAVLKKDVKQLMVEKRIMQSVNFYFVEGVEYVCKDNCYIYFIMPFEAGGELYQQIKKLGSLSEPLVIWYAAQVVLALEYLHNIGICHRDVKPENIFLNESGYAKLGDMGLSKVLKKKTWTLCGTPEYIAPEIVLSKGYGFSVDWWALGILIFEMTAGHPPFTHQNPMILYDKILSGRYKPSENMTSHCKSIVKGLLATDPNKRLGSAKYGVYDIKAHEWFDNTDWNALLHRKLLPPFIPICRDPGDTSNFVDRDEIKLKHAPQELYAKEFANF